METGRWDEAAHGPMTLEAVRRLFQPEARYLMGWNSYPAGASFNGWGRAKRVHVLSGSCVIGVAGREWGVSAGEFLDAPEGDYSFSVPAESPVEIISVWELPESLWRKPED